MKSKVKYFLILLVGFVILAIVLKMNTSSVDVGGNIDVPSEEVSLVTYTNTKYGYSLDYPKNALLQKKYEMERVDDSESFSITIGLPEATDTAGIGLEIEVPYADTAIDLKTFAESEREKFIADKNKNFPDKNISSLEKGVFAGKEAYIAHVSGYPDGQGSDFYTLIYTHNSFDNFIIKYSESRPKSKEIINSFRFVEE